MHSEAKQNENSRVWSRERFIAEPCKKTGGSWLKNSELLEGFQQNTFKGKVKEGCCGKPLGVGILCYLAAHASQVNMLL